MPVADAAALATVGLEPICKVMGAVSWRVTPLYQSGAQQRYRSVSDGTHREGGSGGKHSASSISLAGAWRTSYGLRSGYRTMLDRLRQEAQAAGAHGVVGITVERTQTGDFGNQYLSFLAVGTAVRASCSVSGTKPFTTDLSGAQVAVAMRHGWVPAELVVASVRVGAWVDLESRVQRLTGAPNGEVTAYTDLVNACRHQARQEFTDSARAARADGAVLSSMTLDFEADPQSAQCLATVIATGTALAQFAVPSPPPPGLTIVPLL